MSNTGAKNGTEDTNTGYYQTHWSNVYKQDANNETACEWHTSYERVRSFLSPFIRTMVADGQKKRIVDIGCGGSADMLEPAQKKAIRRDHAQQVHKQDKEKSVPDEGDEAIRRIAQNRPG